MPFLIWKFGIKVQSGSSCRTRNMACPVLQYQLKNEARIRQEGPQGCSQPYKRDSTVSAHFSTVFWCWRLYSYRKDKCFMWTIYSRFWIKRKQQDSLVNTYCRYQYNLKMSRQAKMWMNVYGCSLSTLMLASAHSTENTWQHKFGDQ